MTVRNKKMLSVVIGAVISILLLWALFRNIDFVELTHALKGANYVWLLPNILLIIFTMYLRSWRWKFMMAPIKQVSFSNLLAATCIGFMANNVLPLRLGEFVRAYSLSYQDREISKSASLATIFVERMIFDLVALLMIFGFVLVVSNLQIDPRIRSGVLFAIGIAFIGILFVLALAKKESKLRLKLQPGA